MYFFHFMWNFSAPPNTTWITTPSAETPYHSRIKVSVNMSSDQRHKSSINILLIENVPTNVAVSTGIL
jgi:hypothetical protein